MRRFIFSSDKFSGKIEVVFNEAYPNSRNMHLVRQIWEKMSKAEQIQAIKSANCRHLATIKRVFK